MLSIIDRRTQKDSKKQWEGGAPAQHWLNRDTAPFGEYATAMEYGVSAVSV